MRKKLMVYRITKGSKHKILAVDFEEAQRIAQREAISLGKQIILEQSEAGDRWTEISIVSPSGNLISTKKSPDEKDEVFGSIDDEPESAPKRGSDRALSEGERRAQKPRAFG